MWSLFSVSGEDRKVVFSFPLFATHDTLLS